MVCPSCHRLFHADELRRLVAQADAHEAAGRTLDALAELRNALGRLPHASAQATALRERIARLETTAGTSKASSKVPAALAGLGAVGAAIWKFAAPILFVLSKAKFLFMGLLQAKTLVAMLVSAQLYGYGGSFGFGLIVVASMYAHEVGHVFAFQRYGIRVTAPMFVPGFGAYVRGSQYPEAAGAQADVALAGPLWGAAAGGIVAAFGFALHQQWLLLAAVFIAELNQLNLIPVPPLDGNRAIAVLAPRQRIILGIVGIGVGVASASILGTIAAIGHLVRAFVVRGSAPADAPAHRRFVIVVLVLAVLRGVSAHFAAQ